MSNSTRCAACKSLRRRCSQDCVLAPYFPANNPQRFACVHRIYGASNVTKILERLPVESRSDAADCMTFEASSRIQDPVYGSTQTIFKLQQQIVQTQYEIAKVQAELAMYNAQQQMHQIQQQQDHQNQNHLLGQSSLMNVNSGASEQEEEFHYLDQQQLGGFYHQS
ncbi:LOB domain-containing protein 24-like [Actinidia eriantha]|uniref:LOB domain-containing protein 24-like n=1 Tax=Actinidia eriantha TaxID=165200 RepID=UPI00258405E7|nr:LOB domain-containing protein 24-like [Actinidia eriantha]